MVKPTYPDKPRKASQIPVQFSGHRLTNYGGLSVFSDFLFDKLHFKHHLEQHLHLEMGANCSYSDSRVFGLVVVGFLFGPSVSPILRSSARIPLPAAAGSR